MGNKTEYRDRLDEELVALRDENVAYWSKLMAFCVHFPRCFNHVYVMMKDIMDPI